MDTPWFLLVFLLIFVIKWGYELYTGKKLRKNIIGGPLFTRDENPRAYWGMMLLEFVLVAVVFGLVFVTK